MPENRKILLSMSNNESFLKSADLVGCHRRSTYPDKKDFWCSFKENVVVGPPCTAKKGDTLELVVKFQNLTVADMTQVRN